MDREIAIEFSEIIRELRDEVERLPRDGRVEIVIYKSNNALANYEIRPIRTRRGKITLD